MAAFVDRDDRDGTVAAHLDTCVRCRRIVSALAGVEYDEAPNAATPSLADTEVGSPPAGGEPLPAVIEGQTLGRFTVKRLLGHGGMGEVWAAHDTVLDREVAVKLLRLRHESLGTEAAERLKREAQAMARLRHPNVVAIYDLDSAGGQLFCAMELVDGVTLRTWLQTPRPWRDIFDVVLGIGRGIAAAHASGLVHRDIKPDNVLVTKDGRPLVTDFGLAKLVDIDVVEPSTVRGRGPQQPRRSAPRTESLTMAGSIVGTPVYMPLEQLEGRRVGPHSDQFSFCVTAYEALFGQRPFAGDDIDELIASVSRGASPPQSTNGVPRAVIRALLRGLARDSGDRFPSMDALLDELTRASTRGRRRMRTAVIAGGLVALVSGATAVVWASREDPQDSVRSAATSRMSEIWGVPQRESVRAHFIATGAPLAAEQLAIVLRHLDAYRTSWLAARVDAWAATRVRGEQSQDTLERRIACLERMASSMQVAVRVLSTVEAAEIAKARDVVAALPAIDECSDLARLTREPSLPSTPEGRALDADLQALEVLNIIGRKAEARTKAKAAVATFEESGDRARLARAVFNLGWIEANLGNHTEAETQLRRALELGAAAQDHPLVAKIWLRLFSVVGFEQRKPDAALAFEPAVRAAVLQAGNDPLQEAELAKSLGLVESARGNNTAAHNHFLRSRALYVAARSASHYDVALADINIASVVLLLGQLDEAKARLESAIAAFTADGMARNPTVAQAHQNLCAVAWRKQDWTGSEQHCRSAVDIYAATFGADHPITAKSRMFLGRALRKLGRLEDAQRELEEARRVQVMTMPAGHPERIHTDVYVAQIAEERGNLSEAEALARKALAALREHKVSVHLHPFTLSELARIVSHRSAAEALDFYDEALRIHTAGTSRDPSGEQELLAEIAKVALAAGTPKRALVWFDKLPQAAAALPDVHKTLKAKASR